MAAKEKKYYRGVWVAENSQTMLDPKNGNRAFNEAMREYHRYFPNKENPDDPQRVSATYSLPGL